MQAYNDEDFPEKEPSRAISWGERQAASSERWSSIRESLVRAMMSSELVGERICDSCKMKPAVSTNTIVAEVDQYFIFKEAGSHIQYLSQMF